MATYVVLNTFTEQGIRSVKDTTSRANAARDLAKKFGVTMKEVYWTLGQYDVVAIFEAADDAAITAFTLALGAQGNVHTQILRAFDQNEMKGVLAKLSQIREHDPSVPMLPTRYAITGIRRIVAARIAPRRPPR